MTTAQVVLIGISLVFMMLVLISMTLFLLPGMCGLIIRVSDSKKRRKTVKKAAKAEKAIAADKTAVKESDAAETIHKQDAIKQEDNANDLTLIAAITAAITAYEESTSDSAGSFRVISFKRANSYR